MALCESDAARGKELFRSVNPNDSWDGTFNGQKATEGVYLYVLEATSKFGKKFYLNGNVTLIR